MFVLLFSLCCCLATAAQSDMHSLIPYMCVPCITYRFVLPVILGFIRQLPGLTFTSVADGKTVSATLTLIARRSAQRAGTRHWRRGVDTEGESMSAAGIKTLALNINQ